MRVVFFGTPHFAVPTLDALVTADLAPELVVTQPSRPVGRGRRVVPPPVAESAARHGLEVLQPEKVGESVFMNRLADLAPDIAVVVAFGQIFRQELLDLPRLGCVNLHGSLLPRWRGAAPIQAAIAAGDRMTGVTTMRMEAGLDSGPMLLTESVEIGKAETTPELAKRLAAIGGPLMVRTVEALAEGSLEPVAQDPTKVTLAPRLTKADGEVDWSLPASRIYDRWRGYTPWPGTTARFGGRPLKLIEIEPLEAASGNKTTGRRLGSVITVDGGAIAITCGDGSRLRLVTVQRPGRPRIAAEAWRNGERIEDGAIFDAMGGG